jgi:serine/threonine-protein kinase RsbW
MEEELVRLEIPAQPAFVGVARSVVATVATTVDGIDDDRLDDLRLAVSEACTNAMEGHTDDTSRVVLRCVLGDEALDVHIDDAAGGLSAEAIAEQGWGLQLMTALVDDVDFTRSDGATGVTLRVKLQP